MFVAETHENGLVDVGLVNRELNTEHVDAV